MDKKTKKIAIISVILLFSVVFIGGAFLKKAQAPVVQNSEPMTESKKTDEVMKNDQSGTEGWQTYRNEEYGFEFQYPHSCKIETRENSNKSVLKAYTVVCSDFFVIVSIESSMSYDSQLEKEKKNCQDWLNEFAVGEKVKNYIKESEINGFRTILNTKGCKQNVGEPSEYIIFNSQEKLFLRFLGTPPVESNGFFEKIFSTFKFIEQAGDETADWQAYKNEKYGFEFQYPSNLNLKASNIGNNVVELRHSVPYENNGSCDMVAETTPSKTLDDLTITFEVRDEIVNLEFDDGDYSAGTLNGKYVYEGVEGCPPSAYYFPFKENKTLIVKLWIPQQLSGNVNLAFFEGLMEVPGLIKSDESMKIFDQILATFKFTK